MKIFEKQQWFYKWPHTWLKKKLKPSTSHNWCHCLYKSVRSINLILKLKMTFWWHDLQTENKQIDLLSKVWSTEFDSRSLGGSIELWKQRYKLSGNSVLGRPKFEEARPKYQKGLAKLQIHNRMIKWLSIEQTCSLELQFIDDQK